MLRFLRSRVRTRTAWRRVALAGLMLSICTACGGDSDEGRIDGDPIPIRGGERLSWNQTADSAAQLRLFGFRLYVDGAPSTLTNVRCAETSTANGYDCSGSLPPLASGRHVLELTSVRDGAESAPSRPLIVVVAGAMSLLPPQSTTIDSLSGTMACVEPDVVSCYVIQVLATGLVDPVGLTAIAGDRLLFAENGAAIRIISGGRLLDEPALVLDDGMRVAGLSVDTDFSRTGFVYVAWTALTREGPMLTVSRYRAVQNSLGEAAVVISGLPVEYGKLVPLALRDGLLHIALPAARDGDRGMVLRYTGDGFVPRENRNGSPIVSEGFSTPTGLVADRLTGGLWLAGGDSQSDESIASLPSPGTERSWPARFTLVEQSRWGEAPAVLRPVRFASPTEVVSAAEDENGGLYVAVRDLSNNQKSASILRLRRR